MRVYLDMDPGLDDAVAMATAVGRFEVAGIVTVAGNVEGDKTFRNARHMVDLLGQKQAIAVVAGSDAPLFSPLESAGTIHGDSGFGNWPVPAVTDPPLTALPGWVWLADRLREETAPCHLIPTGPLTNVARLLWGFPHLAGRLASITLMGGSLSGGNVTSTAEFNFYADPDAADAVLGHAGTVRVVGLDVTHRALLPVAQFSRFLAYGEWGRALEQMMRYYAARTRRESGVAVHDALAVMAADRPDLFQWEWTPARVVREGPLRGTLVPDRGKTRRPPVAVAVGVDADGFLDWFWGSLDRVGERGGPSL